VQYADKPTWHLRDYRQALPHLREAVAELEREELDFVIQLGDIIDGRERVEDSRRDLDAVLSVFGQLRAPLWHVVGNHGLAVPRPELQRRLGLEHAYRSVRRAGYRFVLVDTMAAAPAGELAWQGGVGDEQREWLAEELDAAEAAGETALVFAHHPLLAEASEARFVVRDHEETLAVLEASTAAALWMNGHVHRGGYAVRRGIHHVTVEGVVEAPTDENAWAVVELRPGELDIVGHGTVSSRRLALGRR
jgi:3',5'-cyclic AMP phosphodiesterase CpdA